VAWIVLVLAGVLEVALAYSMKLSDGFSRIGYSCVAVAAMISSIGLLSLSMKTLPLGTAYTVWTGIGAVGSFLLGVILLGEPASTLRVVAAVLIVSGLVVMKISA